LPFRKKNYNNTFRPSKKIDYLGISDDTKKNLEPENSIVSKNKGHSKKKVERLRQRKRGVRKSRSFRYRFLKGRRMQKNGRGLGLCVKGDRAKKWEEPQTR